jgi:FkbM family methyltransferase
MYNKVLDRGFSAIRQTFKRPIHQLTSSDAVWRVLPTLARLGYGNSRVQRLVGTIAQPHFRFPSTDHYQMSLDGLLLELNRSNYFQWARSLGLEDHIGRVLVRVLELTPGAFIDVGSNIGFYACLVATRHPDRTILAIEPGVEAYKYLCRHIQINDLGNIWTTQSAVGSARGCAEFYPGLDSGKNSLSERIIPHPTKRRMLVDVETLDSLWGQHGKPEIGCIKIDIEGFEGECIMGARELLVSQRPYILSEFTPHLWSSSAVGDALQFLHELGYHFQDIRASTPARPIAEFRPPRQADVLLIPSHGIHDAVDIK